MAPESGKAAVVTGANKGIGLATVKVLCREFKGTVYLAARNAELGSETVRQLKSDGLEAQFLQLDVTDKKSIEKARDFLVGKHGGLDVLINNAGIAVHPTEGVPYSGPEVVNKTLATNFYGLLNVCNIMFPILRPHARVVNVSSSLGNLFYVKNDALKNRLRADDLTVEELEKIAQDFIKVSEKGDVVEAGYPKTYTAYSFSKVLVTSLTRVQQRVLDQKNPGKDIIINAVCPGFCATDLNHNSGVKTVAQGADSPSYLALLPEGPGIPRGEFVYERKVFDWAGEQKSDIGPYIPRE